MYLNLILIDIFLMSYESSWIKNRRWNEIIKRKRDDI